MTITYEIDPGGDLNLVLRDPNTQRIVPIINKEKGDSNDAFDNPPLVGRYTMFNADEDDSDDQARSEDVIVEVHFHVSSRHLILASRTFRKMLEGNWSESSSNSIQSGRRQIQTTGWDAAAFAIVLDAIHGRHHDIPKCTNLGLLTRIATIVDYYECHESLQLIGDVWMATLRAACKLPTNLCQSTLLWLYISWVFSEKEVTSTITKMLLEESEGLSEIDSFDLPLSGIIDIIETKRQELISRLIDGLDDLRKTLTEEKVCLRGSGDSTCSATMLGILIREAHKLKLLDPPLTSPYNGYSISSLKERIASFPMPRQDNHNYGSYHRYYQGPSSCTIYSRLEVLLEEIDDDMKSFDLTTQE
ncbi:uncharacterized protein B0J16DRAFT_408251 [Fusarium flagelliforme]|uniref:BTB domain-containing protein n=1 Tax=Fusarium flagelliforme TaxID=2675880 RepID=A0A395N752_9HYPO|nr:uncharacterized protein B0J16DRAFT_408251 [Fusarium flagelliforme]KAH7196547.1 hypothetical protein B0J16DRAFT_408251 [Fusarium flagelliforme]RFN55479.1 hypothetical protein FIE12Z_125 [Fusarium flagelliforme]